MRRGFRELSRGVTRDPLRVRLRLIWCYGNTRKERGGYLWEAGAIRESIREAAAWELFLEE